MPHYFTSTTCGRAHAQCHCWRWSGTLLARTIPNGVVISAILNFDKSWRGGCYSLRYGVFVLHHQLDCLQFSQAGDVHGSLESMSILNLLKHILTLNFSNFSSCVLSNSGCLCDTIDVCSLCPVQYTYWVTVAVSNKSTGLSPRCKIKVKVLNVWHFISFLLLMPSMLHWKAYTLDSTPVMSIWSSLLPYILRLTLPQQIHRKHTFLFWRKLLLLCLWAWLFTFSLAAVQSLLLLAW